jgi:hypothetical protein
MSVLSIPIEEPTNHPCNHIMHEACFLNEGIARGRSGNPSPNANKRLAWLLLFSLFPMLRRVGAGWVFQSNSYWKSSAFNWISISLTRSIPPNHSFGWRAGAWESRRERLGGV